MGAAHSYPVVDLTGKIAIVTGGNAGIGYETAKALATMGAHTIVGCRSRQRAVEALARMREEVRKEFPEKELKLEALTLDLASFESTKQFVIAFKAMNLPLHILVNNAAVALIQERNGYEQQFQVNHLSHFLLTLELLPTMTESAVGGDCRIVFVSSLGHVVAEWNPDNVNGQLSYGPLKFYDNSKLYNVMTAYALQRRLPNKGITVSSLHPGVVDTDLNQHSRLFHLFALAVKYTGIAKTPRDGAATSINCAVNPELNSQQAFYYSDCQVTESSALSRDLTIQEQLWRMSVDIVKDYLSPEVMGTYGQASDPIPPAQ